MVETIDIKTKVDIMVAETAAASRRRIEASCIVSDKAESGKLWSEQFKTIAGFKKAWGKVWKIEEDGTVTRVPKVKAVPTGGNPAEVVMTVEAVLTLPEIVYVESQVHNAYTIQQVKGGWCVARYEMDGKVHTVMQLTEPEGKQFALNRLLQFVRRELKSK